MIVAEVYEFKTKVVELFSFFCTSVQYTVRFYFLDHLMEDFRSFENISVFDASDYELFNVHTERAYRWLSKTRATRLQETAMLMEPQRKGKQHAMSTDVESSS